MGDSGKAGLRPVLPPGRFVDLPGRGRTFVRERAGPEGAPVVVLLHGWTATAALNWSPSFGPLADGFRVLAIDHRGPRTRPAQPCTVPTRGLCRRHRHAPRAMGVDRCIAVGYSMGGPIAQLLWQRHPHLVDGLVLCATAATFHGTTRESVLTGMAVGGSLVAGAVFTRPLALATTTVLRGWGAVRHSSWWGLEEIAGHDWGRIVQAGRELCRFDSRPWMRDTSVPTAVIATCDDDVVPHRPAARPRRGDLRSDRACRRGRAQCLHGRRRDTSSPPSSTPAWRSPTAPGRLARAA